MARSETATLAGGCFWCLEAVYSEMQGVLEVQSGYMGGQLENPTYEDVCTGTTGHAEVVQLTYDPDVTTYRELLGVFFTIHDPTTRNRQGNDIGPQYRSAVFYHSEAQKETALEVIAELTREGVWTDAIVTEVEPASTFYPAERYHKDYFLNHPNQPYCSYVVAPKVKKFREKFAAKLR